MRNPNRGSPLNSSIDIDKNGNSIDGIEIESHVKFSDDCYLVFPIFLGFGQKQYSLGPNLYFIVFICLIL